MCPVSTIKGQGSYVELFLIGALNRLQRWQRKRAFLAQISTFKANVVPSSDIDFRFSFQRLCFSCSFLLILNNKKISKKFWAITAHQKFISLISIFLITLINPLKKNNLCGKVSVTHLCRFHPPSAVPGRRERKEISK